MALRNINLIVQANRNILQSDIKFFFAKYNDPIYVKLEKLEIMVKMVSKKNVNNVLLELKEYATEVDVDFVRKSVRAIGRCAIKLDSAAEKAINVLLDLIKTKVNYVVQEAIIVMKDIFRRYPNMYEVTIATLCENLESLDEPEAKASMIWIIGEYAGRIDNAGEILGLFLDSWPDEGPQVQLQLLTAVVKLYLENLKQGQEDRTLVEEVLKMATEETDNPDLRDRAYIYWRLLTQNAEAANAIVLVEKPVIADDTEVLEPGLLAQLMTQLSTLASTYHKPPEAFVKERAPATGEGFDEEDEDDDDYGAAAGGGGGGGGGTMDDDDDILGMGMGMGGGAGAGAQASTSGGGGGGGGGGGDDLLDLMGMGGGGGGGGGGGNGAMAAAAFPDVQKARFATAKPVGFAMQGVLVPGTAPGKLELRIDFANMQMSAPQQRFQLQFNKSFAGIVADAAAVTLPQPVQQGGRGSTVVPCHVDAGGAKQTLDIASAGQPLQAAIKDDANGAVAYFTVPTTYASLACCGLAASAGEGGKMQRKEFLTQWKTLPNEQEIKRRVEMAAGTQLGVAQIVAKLEAANIYVIADRKVGRSFLCLCFCLCLASLFVSLSLPLSL